MGQQRFNVNDHVAERMAAPLLEYDGILRIEVVQGLIFKNTEVWGKMDPYVVLKYQKLKFRTRVHDDGGLNPVWN